VTQADGALMKSDSAIVRMVRLIALEILKDYTGKDPVLVGVLNGSFMFMADLVRALSYPKRLAHEPMYPEVDFIKVNSYDHTHSTGTVNMVSGLSCDIKNRHVIVVEDIVETGLTLQYVKDYLFSQNPTSVSVTALLVKTGAGLDYQHQHHVAYPGFHVGEDFVFGYGLDISGRWRSLNELRILL